MNERLCHDVALMMAMHCFEMMENLLREEDKAHGTGTILLHLSRRDRLLLHPAGLAESTDASHEKLTKKGPLESDLSCSSHRPYLDTWKEVLSMSQERQSDIFENYKRNFNIFAWFATIHQRGIVVMNRKHFGTEALGFPSFFALILMFFWAALTQDIFMWGWIGLWMLFQLKRRMEAARIAGQVHSQYDGWPFDAIRLCGSEKTAKMVVEPVLIAILGGIAYWLYTENGLSPYGLPYFLLTGVVTIPFVEWVRQAAWDKHLRDMQDARLDNEGMLDEYRNRYGG